MLIAGIGCLLAAALVVVAAGLPDRATLTAAYVLADGRVVAPETGAIAPPLALNDPDGRAVRLADHGDRVVVLNYWATWCGPCRVEMPALQALAERHPDALTVLGINAGEPAEAVLAWRQHFGLTFPLLLDPAGVAARDYRLRGQPTTVIVAPGGRIESIIYGPVDIGALERAVAALLRRDERKTP